MPDNLADLIAAGRLRAFASINGSPGPPYMSQSICLNLDISNVWQLLVSIHINGARLTPSPVVGRKQQ